MRATISEEACTGCGLCVDTCPEVFEMEEDKATVARDEAPAGSLESCREAADECPTEAITIDE